MRSASAQMQKYSRGLSSGLLSASEVTSAVLELLADSSNRVELWAGSPAHLRKTVRAYVSEVGADQIPPLFLIGPGETDPIKRSEQTALRRLVAAELLTYDEPVAPPDRSGE